MEHDSPTMTLPRDQGADMARKRRTLRDLRDEAGMTQMQLAQELGCHVRLVAGWEAGEKMPSAKYALQLVDLFDMTGAELLTALENSADA